MSSNLKGANAGKMKRMMTRKSHSWWWDSHISPKNSKWLAENLEEMDRCVKEMLKLIEEEGDSFAKKAEMYYKKRPELISHVEDFYRMYRALAERYDHVTGELRKNFQSDLNSQGSGSGSDFGSEPPSPSLPSFDRTPEPKPTIPKPGHRAAGFEFFLGSGGSSDRSRKGSDDSSSSSESDSDSDDTKDLNGDGDGISSGLHQRILELENELCIVKEKLSEHEKCGELANGADLSSKILVLENDLVVANEKLRVSEAEITSLQQKLKENNLSSEAMNVELGYENMVLSKLETRVVELESEARDNKSEIEDLRGVISTSNQAIEQYKTQLADASEKFLQEKSHLEADIVKLEEVIKELKEQIERISQEKLQLEASTLGQQHLIEELKAAGAVSENFLQEKSHLEANIVKLEGVIKELREEIERISQEKLHLETNILEQQHLIEELKAAAAVSKNLLQEKSHLEADTVKLEVGIKELSEEIERISQEKSQLQTSSREQQHLIEELKAAAAVSENFLREKSHLEADTEKLVVVIKELKEDIERISQEKTQSEARTLEQQLLIEELKATAEVSADKFSLEKSSMRAEISTLSKSSACLEAKLQQLEAEKAEACANGDGQIAELNLSLDALKQKIAMLLLDKDELGERVNTLNYDIRCRDDRVHRMDEHLHQLHLEHVKLVKEIEEARRIGEELRNQVRELEEEVERQRVAISDGAEGKREAIRQLCFSLEHYRDGYHHLLQVLQVHSKRLPTVMAI